MDYGSWNKDSDSVAVSDGYAYIVSARYPWTESTFEVFDVRDPADPILVGSLAVGNQWASVVISGRYAFLNQLDSLEWTVHVIDVGDPSAPVEVGMFDGVGEIAAVAGGYAYAVESRGMWILDLTNPMSPVPAGLFEPTSECDYLSTLTISGNYAYVTSGTGSPCTEREGHLLVVDISDPAAPFEVGRVKVAETTSFDVAVSGDYAFVASSFWVNLYHHVLEVVDVSDPAAPFITAAVDMGAGRSKLTASGRTLYVAWSAMNGESDLIVFDVSDPSEPVEIGSLLEEVWGLQDIDQRGRFVYCAGAGLLVFDSWGCRRPYEPPTPTAAVD
jgi:hypothetical protein